MPIGNFEHIQLILFKKGIEGISTLQIFSPTRQVPQTHLNTLYNILKI